MKYTVYIENNQLVFLPKRGKGAAFNLDEILCFMIDDVHTDSHMPLIINGVPFFIKKKNPITYGSIIIGFKEYLSKSIQKSKHKKVINKYSYFKIKHIHNIFDIAEKIINLGIDFADVPFKNIYKYDLNNKIFYSKEISLTNGGPISTTKYERTDL